MTPQVSAPAERGNITAKEKLPAGREETET